jgi:hypothetical protein
VWTVTAEHDSFTDWQTDWQTNTSAVFTTQDILDAMKKFSEEFPRPAKACDSLHGRDYDIAKAVCDEVLKALTDACPDCKAPTTECICDHDWKRIDEQLEKGA